MKKQITITTPHAVNVGNYRKESKFYKEFAAINPKTGEAEVKLRFYSPQGWTRQACVWIHTDKESRVGGASSNYSGNTELDAARKAFASAGIEAGPGFRRCGELVEAIARKVTGKRRFIIHEAKA
jgi:hypothetical protein|tara:strand:- start:719 stop:1093 length:375 start_codon:yes stop_codon:yes gene_type:complete